MKKLMLILALGLAEQCSANPVFPKDKVTHFCAGATLSGFGYCFAYNVTHKKPVSLVSGLAFATVAGVAKEIYDRRLYGSPVKESLKDFGWTMFGGVAASVTIRFTF